MMQSEGTAGAQHEFVEKIYRTLVKKKTNQFLKMERESFYARRC